MRDAGLREIVRLERKNMKKKIDLARDFLAKHLSLFQCPICHQSFYLRGQGLVCAQSHQFDLSKKGTLYFLSHQIHTEYNQKMLLHRGKMIHSGMYQPVLDLIFAGMKKDGVLVDVGCGEGGFLQGLTTMGLSGTKIGFDISKEGVYLASNYSNTAFWCAADLTNLPFADTSVDVLLNIFSPSHYQEFQRVLKDEGSVIKVIPETNYLQELRRAFYPEDQKKQFYSNEQVIERFAKELVIFENERVTYTFSVPKENRLDLLEMSPLEWRVSKETKRAIQESPLEEITVDVRMLKGTKR